MFFLLSTRKSPQPCLAKDRTLFSRRCVSICLVLVSLLSLAANRVCLAQAGSSQPETNNAEPINIEADRMEAEQQRNLVVFSGHVEARQGSLVITSERMVVNYLPAERVGAAKGPAAGTLSQRVGRIEAYGNVKIVKDDWVATGEAMEYFSGEKKVKLLGNAKAWQGKNTVTGDSIVLFLEQGRSVVERGGKEGERVKALIYSGETPAADSGRREGQ